MSLIQKLVLFSGLSILIINHVETRSARRLEGESIIGGEDADEGQFPYQISLRNAEKPICGGSILDEQFVITAAHCVISSITGEFKTEPLQVVAGTNDLNSKSSEHKVVVDVAEVFVPKEYDPIPEIGHRNTGDIAVLKLKKNLGIENNPNLNKIELPKKGNTYAGVDATISGFGWNKVNLMREPVFGIVVETGGKSYGKMRFAKVKVFEHAKCGKAYSDVDRISSKHICAQVEQRDEDVHEGVCSGDSGSPLVYEKVIIGVVNTSPIGCIENVQPGVYTRVTEFVEFINKVVSGNIDEDISSFAL